MMTGLLNYQIILIDISELKPEQFQGHPVLQAVLESLQLASKGWQVAEFDRVMDRLTAVKKDPRVKGWLPEVVALVEAGLLTVDKAATLAKATPDHHTVALPRKNGLNRYFAGVPEKRHVNFRRKLHGNTPPIQPFTR